MASEVEELRTDRANEELGSLHAQLDAEMTVRPSEISRRVAKSLHPALRGSVRPSLRVRLRTSWSAAALDQALAAGADPLHNGELLWRAQQLTEPNERITIASSIARVVAEAVQNEPAVIREPRLAEDDLIKDNRSLLLVLAERLRSGGPHDLRGLAMADLLVHFGNSPLYCGRTSFALRSELLQVLEALEPTPVPDGPLAAGNP